MDTRGDADSSPSREKADVEPIPETVQAAMELEGTSYDGDLLDALIEKGRQVREIVPDCLGLTLAMLEHGVAFTLVASAQDYAVLDGIQYLTGGPCVAGGDAGEVRNYRSDDVLDEADWRLFAQAAAARAVQSTLTLPILAGDRVTGSVNLYGASARAFDGHHDDLARVLGAWAPGAVTNADLSFRTRAAAEQAPRLLQEQSDLAIATGIVAARRRVQVERAERLLEEAARRAGITLSQLATALVELQSREDQADSR